MNRSILCLVIAPLLLAGCSENKPPASSASNKPNVVSVVAMQPQTVTLTSEFGGRIVAVNAAEIRPQVTGLIVGRAFTEGSDVKKGDLLYRIDPDTYQAALASAQATLARAQAAERNAATKTERLKRLNDERAVSSQDYEDALLALGQAKADVASAEAAIKSARINLEDTEIRAPVDGRIDASTVNVGALVTSAQTTALTTIRQLDPIYVEISQPSENLLRWRQAVREGKLKHANETAVRLTLEDGSRYEHEGKLQFAEASISETAGSVTVRAVFPNPDHLLLPGMYVRAVIEDGQIDNAYLAPQLAVDRNVAGDAIAKIVGADGKIVERKLGVARSRGNAWVVTTGLSPGDRLVVEGGQKARAGDVVEAKEVKIDPATGDIAAATPPASQSETGSISVTQR
jgi:membrane fusion protein (multidrug efflux system)